MEIKLKIPKTAEEKRTWIIQTIKLLPRESIEKIFESIKDRLEECLYWSERMKMMRNQNKN